MYLYSPFGKAKERTSPLTRVTDGSDARWGDFRSNASGSRVRTVALALRRRSLFIRQKLSNNQQPKNPVPPVINIRWPRASSHRGAVCSKISRKSCGARGLAGVISVSEEQQRLP